MSRRPHDPEILEGAAYWCQQYLPHQVPDKSLTLALMTAKTPEEIRSLITEYVMDKDWEIIVAQPPWVDLPQPDG